MRTTLRQIDAALDKVAAGHLQVADYFWGDWQDSYSEREQKYPAVVCNVPPNLDFSKITKLQLNIICVDQVRKGNENLKEVESDTLQILHDFYRILKHAPNWKDFCVVASCTVPIKFKDKAPDDVAGWQATLSLKLIESEGLCDLPMDGYDYSDPIKCAILPPAFPPVTVTLNSSPFLTLPSGSSEDIELIDQGGNTIAPINVTDSVITMNIPVVTPLYLVDFFTISINNLFGNTNRFTDELGGQNYASGIVIDWSSWNTSTNKVCGVTTNITATGNLTYADVVSFCASFTAGGFSTWFAADFDIFQKLARPGDIHWFMYPPFNGNFSRQYWIGTDFDANQAYVASAAGSGIIVTASKIGLSGRAFPARNFFWNGSGLT